ncbi:MAG: O-linked GlcNAc transferase [Candidatus Scalindua rubra]|uniref:O-linked GlcNAc transferase n=1 Tax=Candidatus Scalindua rubra TaxID=1872076 RepID=A0A1E3X571_9BACT|nr:MAG: O-linked GlcNAc transferase [Candidatus Scalindua rubra]
MKITWFITLLIFLQFILLSSGKILAGIDSLENLPRKIQKALDFRPEINGKADPVETCFYGVKDKIGKSPVLQGRDIRGSQNIPNSNVRYSDDKLFQDLMQVDDESLDIAKMSLLIAKEECTEIKIGDYVECIDWYARMIKTRILNNNKKESIVKIMNEFLFNEIGFTYVQTGNLEDLYLNNVIDRRKGNCVGMSILYLSVAERLRLPLFGVNVPEHIFIRYDDGETRINIETGHEGMSLPDSFYITHSIERFDKESVKNGCYLRNLTKKEVVSNVFLNRSKIRRENGNLKEALDDCNKAILLSPRNPGAYCNRGVIYEKMGMISQAIGNYSRAISLNHEYASAYYNRGSAYGVEGKLKKSIEDFDKAIAINPGFTLSYYNRAIAYKKIGQVEKAIQDYDKVIDIDPDFAQAYCNRGVAFAETGRFDSAINDFNEAIEIDPELGDAYFARGILFADTKKLKKAIEDFGECIRLSPGRTFVYYLRGKAYKEIGETEKAIQDFNKAITIRPYYAGLYVDRGILLFQTGRIDEAITDFDKSLELFPKNPIAFRYRGESFKKKGQFKKAIEDFKSFLEIAPDSPDADIIRNEIRELK